MWSSVIGLRYVSVDPILCAFGDYNTTQGDKGIAGTWL